jgi:hypothetical protein
MKAPLFEMGLDLGKMAAGEAIYDWKGDRVTEITDSSLEKLVKLAVHEAGKTEPIAASVFKTARRRQVAKIIAFAEAVTGVRPTLTEKAKRERDIMRRAWSLKGQREELFVSLASLRDPRGAIRWYNAKVVDVLEGPLVPDELRKKWQKELTINLEEFLQNKASAASAAATTDQSKANAARAVRVLQNFGITAQEAVNLRRAGKARRAAEPKRRAHPLESKPIIGDLLKERRLRERLGTEKQEK